MPDNPFDRVILNPKEKPLSEDINRALSQLDRSTRLFAKTMFTSVLGAPISGFLPGGFNAVQSSPLAMSVILKAGLGFQDDPLDVPSDIDGILGLDDLESYKPLPLLADLTIAIPTAPTAPNSRIDIIEVRADRLKTDTQSREVFNESLKVFQPTSVDKTLEFLLDGSKLGSVASPANSTDPISLKVGTIGTPGIAPATSPGYLKIAEVFVDGDVTTIVQADISDFRQALIPSRRASTSVIPALLAQPDSLSVVSFSNLSGYWATTANPAGLLLPVSGFVPVGAKVTGVQCSVINNVLTTLSCTLYEGTSPGAIRAAISDTVLSTQLGHESVGLTNINFNGGSQVLEANKQYWVFVQMTGGNFAGQSIGPAHIQWELA